MRRDDAPVSGLCTSLGGSPAPGYSCLRSPARWYWLVACPPVLVLQHEATGILGPAGPYVQRGLFVSVPFLLSSRVLRVFHVELRGVFMGNLTLYLSDELLERMRAAAAADRRSLSQWVTICAERSLLLLPPGAFPPDHPRRLSQARQVDLEDAIRSARRSAPVRSRGRARPK